MCFVALFSLDECLWILFIEVVATPLVPWVACVLSFGMVQILCSEVLLLVVEAFWFLFVLGFGPCLDLVSSLPRLGFEVVVDAGA